MNIYNFIAILFMAYRYTLHAAIANYDNTFFNRDIIY